MAINSRVDTAEGTRPAYPMLVRGRGTPGAAAATTILLQLDQERGVCLYAAPGDSKWAAGDFSESLDSRFWEPLPAGLSITITAV